MLGDNSHGSITDGIPSKAIWDPSSITGGGSSTSSLSSKASSLSTSAPELIYCREDDGNGDGNSNGDEDDDDDNVQSLSSSPTPTPLEAVTTTRATMTTKVTDDTEHATHEQNYQWCSFFPIPTKIKVNEFEMK